MSINDKTFSCALFIIDIKARGAGCFWAGTAPFCMAKCPNDFRTLRADRRGDGHPCLTGSKFFCCPPLPPTTTTRAPPPTPPVESQQSETGLL